MIPQKMCRPYKMLAFFKKKLLVRLICFNEINLFILFQKYIFKSNINLMFYIFFLIYL